MASRNTSTRGTAERRAAAAAAEAPAEEQPQPWQVTVLRQLWPAFALTAVLVLITGVIYPLVTMGIGQVLFHSQANGSLIYVDGKPVGSSLIGQEWTQPQYFHGRPSATSNLAGTPSPYEADNSTASNLGPTNSVLIQNVQANIAELKKENPDVPANTPIPVDLVTSSGSGLDPDISVAGAYYQIPRVAKARGLSQQAVQQLVDQHITGRFLGVYGDPFVNVLQLNLALDQLSATSTPSSPTGTSTPGPTGTGTPSPTGASTSTPTS
jgi:K+-transporting ATPase ATPase C chain